MLNCEICGVPLHPPLKRTCSVSCRGRLGALSRKPRQAHSRSCVTCGGPVLTKTYGPHVYCETHRRPACAECGKPVTLRRNKFCSPHCQNKAGARARGGLVGPNNPRWGQGAGTVRGSNWHKIRASIRERDGNTCQDCGATKGRGTKKLDVHHLKPAKDWANPGTANDSENLVTLCVGCHMKRHADPEAAAARARARARTYYQTHKAELGAYRKAYWAEHKEQRRVIQKRWDDKNRARKRAEREST